MKYTLIFAGLIFGSALLFSEQQKPREEYTVAAVLYQQQTGEWRALAYQAFDLATLRLDAAVKKHHQKPLAIITDLDETVLDNSAFQGQLIKDDSTYTGAEWKEWVNKKAALALPGAVDFFQHAAAFKESPVFICYLTNRDVSALAATMENMNRLGFPQVTAEHFRMGEGTSDKEVRRQSVMNDYDVVMQLGDNLNDFSGRFYHKSYTDRKRLTDSLKSHFGRDYIALPNAMYGDWESGLYQPFKSKNQDSIRHVLLRGYKKN